ncbi:leucine-rich repeat domain-containing protein [Treponema sp.]|uniref:leucine-rich repeat domain-containing protein n=1 Tax=Treponema sp. TaxID=166 RepID=UPI00298E2BF1|nr:leucine-rich repeat domain-containing protein [Treponema sp.]MCQ2240430.1 leucine-rich repeat domain-containing protein [Treponema sp.]
MKVSLLTKTCSFDDLPFVLLDLKESTHLIVKNSDNVSIGKIVSSLKRLNSNSSKLKVSLDLSDLTDIEDIVYGSFKKCSALYGIILPESLVRICEEAFAECTSLNYVHCSGSLRIIEDKAFSNCINLEQCTFPNELENIGNNIFENCSSLKKINSDNFAIDCGFVFSNDTLFSHYKDLRINSVTTSLYNTYNEDGAKLFHKFFHDVVENIEDEENSYNLFYNFYRLLSDFGNPLLGILYYYLAKEFIKLKHWENAKKSLYCSCLKDCTLGFYDYAMIYLTGKTGIINRYAAEKFFFLAANNGNQEARKELSKILERKALFPINSSHYFLEKIYKKIRLIVFNNDTELIEFLAISEYYLEIEINITRPSRSELKKELYNTLATYEQKSEEELSKLKLQEFYNHICEFMKIIKINATPVIEPPPLLNKTTIQEGKNLIDKISEIEIERNIKDMYSEASIDELHDMFNQIYEATENSPIYLNNYWGNHYLYYPGLYDFS